MRRRTGSARALGAALVLAGVAVPSAASADAVEYYATVDRTEIGLDETVTLSVTLALSEDREPKTLVLPGTDAFDVVSRGSSSQMSFAWSGGSPSFRKVKVTTIVLRPKSEGTLPIEPGVAVVDGKRYETGRISVKVGAPGSGSRQAPAPRGSPPTGTFPPGFGLPPGFEDDQDPFGSILGGGPQPGDNDIFLRSTVDKRDAYIGEQVTLSVYLMSRLEISGIEAFKMPKLDGFWAEDIESPSQISGELRYVDGVPYRAYLLKRRALFPLKAGQLPIDPVEVDVATGFSFLSSGRKVHRKSPGASIEVKPLPKGAPAGFATGNVGQWELEVTAEPMDVSLGAPVTVRVVANGKGSLRSLELPALPRIPGFKVFEPTRDDKPIIKNGRYGGRKSAEYVMVPEQAGAATIPALALVTFDPKTGSYRTGDSSPIQLRVRPGTGGVASAGPAHPSSPDAPASGLKAIRPAPAVAVAGVPLYDRPWFLPLLLVPALVVLGAQVAPRLVAVRARGEGGRRVKRAGKVARKRLAGSTALGAARDRKVYAELDRALHEYLATKLGRPTVGLSREELVAVIVAAGAPAPTADAVREVLDACDVGRFAPGAVDAAAVGKALDRAHEAIDELEAAKLAPAPAPEAEARS